MSFALSEASSEDFGAISGPGRLEGRPDDTAAREKRALQESLDYWSAFWYGLDSEAEWNRQDAQNLRHLVYETYEVPKRRSWAPDARGRPDAGRPRMVEFDPRRRIRLDPYTLLPQQTNPAMLPRVDASIASGRMPVLRALDPLGFRFKKTLGMGGGGMAVLVELVDRNGQADEWVIKVPLGSSKLGREARNMRTMLGARHMIQRKFVRSSAGLDPADTAIINTDADDCLIGMELLKYGSVDRLLRKLSSQDLKLRDDELWKIFHCLFRACVAMAYPGIWSGVRNPETDLIPVQDENIPDMPIEIASSMVHFDIDPDNILIGDFDSDPGSHTHEDLPIFKVADLGIARRLHELHWVRDNTVAMLNSRTLGKIENHAPEQFAREWDYLAGPPSRTNEPVAGNYSWKTNLYAIGNVMWQLVTRYSTLMPPNPEDIEFSPDGVNPVTGITYGADLIFGGFAQEYDMTLRTLIMWCMMHDPAKRPSMEQLEHLIVGNIQMYQDQGGSDGQGRTTVRDALSLPPRPPPMPDLPILTRMPTPSNLSTTTPSMSTESSLVSTLAGPAVPTPPQAQLPGPRPGVLLSASPMHVAATRARGAAPFPVRLTSAAAGWGAFDAGVGAPPRLRRAARLVGNARPPSRANLFRGTAGGGGVGGGLRNAARRAGRNIRRVFRGAVDRVTGGGTGGTGRQMRPGRATVQRPSAQGAGAVPPAPASVEELQREMAAMGFYGF